jgi:hypothetical protein
MRARLLLLVLAGALATASCTSSTTTSEPAVSGSTIAPTTSPPATPTPTGATLADGTALPDGCTGKPVASETVGFAADGRAWALDPSSGRLACLFDVRNPGPFAFGPQGDRVLLGGSRIEGLTGDAPTWPGTGASPTVFDWGHPIGLAIVYAGASGEPEKRFMDDGSVEHLSALPTGTYQAIAYHPSGLALAFIVDEGNRQGIWISTNEGKDPQRLVFSRPETTFSSLAFSADGQELWWIAQHPGSIAEIHDMDLTDRTGFGTILTRGLDATAHGLLLAPVGALKAATQGADCTSQQAMVIDAAGASPAIADATGPTESLGWLDASTLLVAEGGCHGGQTLVAVSWHQHAGHATVLVNDVDTGAPRTVVRNAPTEVPVPPNESPPAPPGGVG